MTVQAPDVKSGFVLLWKTNITLMEPHHKATSALSQLDFRSVGRPAGSPHTRLATDSGTLKVMRSVLPALLLLSVVLVACRPEEVRAPDAYPLAGTVSGRWGDTPRLRLALVGTGIPGAVKNDSAIGQNLVSSGLNSWEFGFDLPAPGVFNVAGVYQVVVFNDANNDTKYNVGETFARNRQWLIVSPVNGDFSGVNLPDFLGGAEALPAMTVRSGWNVYDQSQPLGNANPAPFTTLTSYDLSR